MHINFHFMFKSYQRVAFMLENMFLINSPLKIEIPCMREVCQKAHKLCVNSQGI